MSSSLFRKIFTNLFPPPRFLQMPSVGFDISDKFIRIADIKRAGKGIEFGLFVEEPIPDGVIEEGFIKDKDEFKKVLTAIRKKHGLYFVQVSMPDEKAYLFRTQIPVMDEADIRGVLQFKIEENVPITLVHAVYDYVIVNKGAGDSMHLDVGVTVMHTRVVSTYLNCLYAAGLMPTDLRTEAQSIARAIIPWDDSQSHIIIGIRETKIVFALVSRGVVEFTSTLHIDSTAVIAAVNTSDTKTPPLMHQIDPGVGSTSSTALFNSLASPADAIKDEVQKLLIYWDSHTESQVERTMSSIILTGAAALGGLDRYLAHAFPIPVQVADAWKNIINVNETVPPITLEESLNFIPAIGLAAPHD